MSERVEIGLAPLRSMAGIAAFHDQSALQEVLQREFGARAPAEAGFVESGSVRLCRIGPSRFLVSGAREADLPRRLARLLEGVAAVTDQSDLWSIFAVSGAGVREVLSRVVPVDLHPAKFAVGVLAMTRVGHLDVRLFRMGENCFEITVARSYATDLRHLLQLADHR